MTWLHHFLETEKLALKFLGKRSWPLGIAGWVDLDLEYAVFGLTRDLFFRGEPVPSGMATKCPITPSLSKSHLTRRIGINTRSPGHRLIAICGTFPNLNAIPQARFKVSKSTSPCWLVNATFFPLLVWCCCTPEIRWPPRIIHLDLAVAGIDREAMLTAKKCLAHFVLTAG